MEVTRIETPWKEKNNETDSTFCMSLYLCANQKKVSTINNMMKSYGHVAILTACFRVADIFVATLLPSISGPPTLSHVCIITNTSSTPIPITGKILVKLFGNSNKKLS